jgi:hypothetical protein
MAFPQSSLAHPPGATMTRQHCPKCRSNLILARVIPGLRDFADRIFECSKCDHIQMMPAISD